MTRRSAELTTAPAAARRRRIVVVMPGHLSTTPRMLKAADSFAAAGYDVRVVSAAYEGWSRDADRHLAAGRPWNWAPVEHGREENWALYTRTGARRHVARATANTLGPDRAPWWAATRAVSRSHDELVRSALSEPFDLVYGGSIGGVAVVEEIAERAGTPFGLDLEDLHWAESVAPGAALQHRLADRVLHRVMRRAAFTTTSTETMAQAYADRFGVRPTVIHNVFALPSGAPSLERRPGPLRLYWFSQTIGPSRGIEDAIAAVAAVGVPATLTIRGVVRNRFADEIRQRAQAAPDLAIEIVPPASPDLMVDLCAQHDVGISGETEPVENRRACLGNKIFTYLLAGLPVALSDTPAQRQLAAVLRDAAFLYSPNAPDGLGKWLAALSANDILLRRHREAAWAAAVQRWHWGHPAEEGALLQLVEQALQ